MPIKITSNNLNFKIELDAYLVSSTLKAIRLNLFLHNGDIRYNYDKEPLQMVLIRIIRIIRGQIRRMYLMSYIQLY